jgi:hypothetical protein
MPQAISRALAGSLSSGKTGKREAAVLEFSKQVATVLYDFSVDGGAVGTVSFGLKLPANAVVVNVHSDEQTNITSGGAATLKLVAGSTDLLGATAIASFASVKSHNPTDPIKLSSASELKMEIGTAALTAGKLRWAVEYYISK